MSVNPKEPILHIARRAIRYPEQLRISEIKRLGLWIEAAYKQREKEVGNISGYSQGFTEEGNQVLEVGRKL